MQIVIDIPEEKYNYVKKQVEERIDNPLKLYIANGTALPKGHGRLIDADRIITEATERMKYPANHKYMECVIAHMKLAETIIEADKAESEVQQ